MSLRILFVEKDATTADLLVPSLLREGYQVAVVQSPRDALARIRSRWAHLMVLDVASFGANGYKVNDTIRAKLTAVPTILLLEEGRADVGATADAFMTAPFTARKLLHRVRKVAGTVASREIRFGPFALDPDTRLLDKGDTTVHLRPKEAALLLYFVKNSGKVLSRPEIIRQVWQTEYVADTRTLNVHVRWIRQKIEEDPNAPRFLRTVRGVGYRFEVPGSGQP